VKWLIKLGREPNGQRLVVMRSSSCDTHLQVHLLVLWLTLKLDCMIDVRRLQVLRELADRGTVAAAATALYLTPSAVSQQLAALSREVGTQLLEPDGRRLRLTPAAHVLLDHAHRVFAELEQAETDLASYAAGATSALRIGAFPTALAALVAPAARRLRGQEPPVAVQAVEAEERASFGKLAAGDLDIAISVEFGGAPQAEGPRFYREPLLTDILDAALPIGHPAAGEDSIELARLGSEDWVMGSPGTSCYDVVMVACGAAGFTPRAIHHTSDWVAVAALVADGSAVALIPRLAQALVPSGVALLPLRDATAARHIFVATRRGNQTGPTIASGLACLRSVANEPGRWTSAGSRQLSSTKPSGRGAATAAGATPAKSTYPG
jgi:DNA-binding transcriptional LysR family regulator